MIALLYEHYMEHPEHMPVEYYDRVQRKDEDVRQVACDFVAGMTDRYAVKQFENLTVPKTWLVM